MNYFREDEVKKLLYIINSNKHSNIEKEQQYCKLVEILNDLNIRVINKKFLHFCKKFNLIQDYHYLKTERDDLIGEIITQQLQQLKRFDESKGTKLFSFLTSIQENVIKYRVQNLVKETNYFVYLDGINSFIENDDNDVSAQDFIVSDDFYNEKHKSKKYDQYEIIKSHFNDFKQMTIKQFFDYYFMDNESEIDIIKFYIVYEKYNQLINKFKQSSNNYKLQTKYLNQIMILNKYLLYFYYKSIRVKRRYNKKNKKYNYIFDIEQKIKYVKDFSHVFGFKINNKIDLNDVYELFES